MDRRKSPKVTVIQRETKKHVKKEAKRKNGEEGKGTQIGTRRGGLEWELGFNGAKNKEEGVSTANYDFCN